MNAQEIFDKVSRALLKQNRKSTSGHDRASAGVGCAFFSEQHESDRCAIGHIIPDEMVEFIKTNHNTKSLPGLCSELHKSEFEHHPFTRLLQDYDGLLSVLQSLHDNAPLERWHERLVYTAHTFQLSPHALEIKV